MRGGHRTPILARDLSLMRGGHLSLRHLWRYWIFEVQVLIAYLLCMWFPKNVTRVFAQENKLSLLNCMYYLVHDGLLLCAKIVGFCFICIGLACQIPC